MQNWGNGGGTIGRRGKTSDLSVNHGCRIERRGVGKEKLDSGDYMDTRVKRSVNRQCNWPTTIRRVNTSIAIIGLL